MNCKPENAAVTIIVLDYSGTLSLMCTEFGKSGRLEEELVTSGLADFGVRGARFFWNEMVNPAWEEGSTTRAGYHTVLLKRLHGLLKRSGPVRQKEIADALSRFTSRYFDSCRIDERWKHLLRLFAKDPGTLVIIATDHYIEATHVIIEELSRIDIEALSISGETVPRSTDKEFFYIANSAELGFHKSDRRFWESVALKVPESKGKILLVDDFGYNESSESSYNRLQCVKRRKSDMIASLSSVFGSRVTEIAFLVQMGDEEKNCGQTERMPTFTVKELIEMVEEKYEFLSELRFSC